MVTRSKNLLTSTFLFLYLLQAKVLYRTAGHMSLSQKHIAYTMDSGMLPSIIPIHSKNFIGNNPITDPEAGGRYRSASDVFFEKNYSPCMKFHSTFYFLKLNMPGSESVTYFFNYWLPPLYGLYIPWDKA